MTTLPVRLRATLAHLLVAAVLLAACQPAATAVLTPAPTSVAATTAPTSAPATTAPTETAPTSLPESVGPTGQLKIAQTADISTLDPKFLRGRETQNVMRLLFDSLYHRDDQMQIIPWLATAYENPDELTWRFHLREGVQFSNGNDFRANDVKFTIERLMEEDSVWADRSFLDTITVMDDFTVDIKTKQPYAAFLTRAVLWHMLDEEYFTEVGADGFLAAPIGTGPFTFVSWVKDEQVVLEANADYWGGAPLIETVVFIPIPEASTRLAALEADDVDLVTDVPPAYASQPGAGVEVATIPGTRAFYLGLNVNVEPFTDVLVRQAMNYAVNVPEIIEFVLNGLARPIDNPLLPEAFGYSPTPVYSYDPDMAVSLLTAAGYADGFEMVIDTDPTLKEIAEALAGQLSAVGIDATVNVMERAAFVGQYEPGGSQAFLTSWGNSEADADGILSKQFYSKRYGCDLVAFAYPAPESGFGDADKGCYYTGYGNADVDAAVEEGARNVDPAARQAAYTTALNIIVEEAPWVFLYNPSEIYAHKGLQGWTPRSDALINLANASVTE